MIKIKSLSVGDIDENVYLIENKKQIILIDPGTEYEKIKSALNGKPCTHILLTHAHFDHIGAVAKFQRDGAKVYLHNDDVKLLSNNGNLAGLFGAELDAFTPDVILHGGEILNICNMKIRVLSTPGHTDGSVCYVLEDKIFSGDTLFHLSVGRTDFPTGNSEKLHKSINEILFKLEGDYKVFSGHGMETLLSFEKENNPYV